jgi:hypothetical protein
VVALAMREGIRLMTNPNVKTMNLVEVGVIPFVNIFGKGTK